MYVLTLYYSIFSIPLSAFLETSSVNAPKSTYSGSLCNFAVHFVSVQNHFNIPNSVLSTIPIFSSYMSQPAPQCQITITALSIRHFFLPHR